MKLLFFQWKAFMQRGMESALKRLCIDYDVFFYQFENWDKDDPFLIQLEEKIIKNNYDTVLSVNFAPLVSDVCQKYNVTYLSWVYDSPIHIRKTESLKNSCNRIYFFDRGQCELYQKQGITGAYHMPLAVDTKYLEAITVTAAEEKAYAADVSFIGQLYKSEFTNLMRPLSQYQRGLLEGFISAQQKIYGGYLIDELLTDEIMKDLNAKFLSSSNNNFMVLKEELSYALAREITGRDRYTALALLSGRCHVNLYSQDADERLTGVHLRGCINSETRTPKVYRASKINLNISIRTIRTGIPLRVLDIMGAGGFLITNYQEELLEYFEPGTDLILYENMQDLVRKVRYYLEHEAERAAIAKNGYNKIKEFFTMESRIKKILELE